MGNGVTHKETKGRKEVPVGRLGCIMYSVMVGLVTVTTRIEMVEENVNAKTNQTM